MKRKNCIVLILLALLGSLPVSALNINTQYHQNIRGKITDHETKQALVGANIIVLNSDPFKGTASDIDGNFILDHVEIGRVSLHITCMGYEAKTIANIELGSAKEVFLEIELIESITKIQEVKVYPKTAKHETLNKMALVSGQAFTVEETSRYSGALNDPARMVSAYAGVSSDGEGSNEIIVRGNSPKGIQWRLEGIEIPNPNHFADEGSTGGAVNALNSNLLRNSDFFTGAFSAEYGNAYSGIFDINLRSGNNARHEQTFGFSTMGIDFTLEGPIKKGYSGSYLANYRYSSLELLNNAGIVDFDGIPKYQDGSFKLVLPTKKVGKFSIFGLFGKSNMLNKEETDDESITLGENEIDSDLQIVGMTNLLPIGKKSYLKNTLAYSASNSKYKSNILGNEDRMFLALKEKYQHDYLKFVSNFNTKLNAKNSIKAGIQYTHLGFDISSQNDFKNTGSFISDVNSDGNSHLLQSFVNWKYRITPKLSLVSGVHASYFSLNDDQSIEPRIGLKYNFLPNQSLSFGFGVHSKLESLSTYFIQLMDENDMPYTPNKNLKMSKARHYVLGYNNQLNRNLQLKIEAYYQDLYDLAVENDPNSKIVLQDIKEGLADYDFVNEGSGKNYGIELTLERFFHNNFYYLFSGSLYQSKFTALDGIERNSRYNGNYTANLLIGKEYKVGKEGKNRIGWNGKVSFRGGQYYTPVDLIKSQEAGETIYKEDSEFSIQADDLFVLNATFSYKVNRKKTRHEFKLDIKNLTNNQAKILERYNKATHEIENGEQLSILPSLYYILHF
ncbi:TonB-dependent receptor [Marinifilum caeruleilacunae]|uniref:TonB-dependent receptor n=1 Tax=Marinifilum caeruleilacunae TaxID=2499076 RepID=A0ABX1X0K7_9BACT|nr:TonB-dependent receptor [Marinifilum caeruleilacunae]NOU61897.1 TonB-dependent receptor [Marinifilum caeruleilacunae]